MPYSVTVKQDNLPDGADVSITGLGTFKNGETTEVSDEQAELFRVMNARLVDTKDKEGNVLVGNYERELGPTLESINIYGVSVEKAKPAAKSTPKSDEKSKPEAQKSGEDSKEG